MFLTLVIIVLICACAFACNYVKDETGDCDFFWYDEDQEDNRTSIHLTGGDELDEEE